jgi:hypothetical protein
MKNRVSIRIIRRMLDESRITGSDRSLHRETLSVSLLVCVKR